ncbi:MAG: c-type cytochrome biogenesis protein CcsB [Pseudomonadota bacterium]
MVRLSALFYFLGAAGFAVFLVRQNKKAASGALYMFAAGFLIQSLALAAATIEQGQLPVLNLGQALTFFGWSLAGAYLLLNWKFKLPVLGAFSALPAAGLTLLGAFSPDQPAMTAPVYKSAWLTLHLGAVFIGYAFFGLAGLIGLMYLAQEAQIKRRKTGKIFKRLPSLNLLDNLNYYCLTLGFPLITLGIFTGAFLSRIAFGTYWRWDPKEVWTMVVWLVYAVLLHQRLTVGWRGRRAAVMAIVGFAVICFTFLGVSVLFPSYHSFESLQRLQGP